MESKSVLVLALGLMPLAASADVYKCKVDGRTVYQDTPCGDAADAEPYRRTARNETAWGMAIPEYEPRPEVPGQSRLAALHRQIQDARRHAEHLRTLYDADVKATRAKALDLPPALQDREAEALRMRWQPRLRQADERLKALTEEVRRLCPKGAVLNDRQQLCSR